MASFKKFEKFSDLMNYRKTCPLCDDELTYKISTDITIKKAGVIASTLWDLKNKLSQVIKEPEEVFDTTVSVIFKPSESTVIEFKEINTVFKLNENITLVEDFDTAAGGRFDLKIYCPHDIIGNGFESSGSFDLNIDMDLSDITQIPKVDNKFSFEIDSLRINTELYKICNLFLEDNQPNGNFIKIMNDYVINKTSFSMAEINLDGTCGVWKEKRIDLVKDDFFKFENPRKIYSRINSLFILQ